MYNLPFGVTMIMTAAMVVVGGAIIAIKKSAVAAAIQTWLPKASQAVTAMGGAFAGGLVFLKNIPKKRGWWKEIPRDAYNAAAGFIQSKWIRIKKRGKEIETPE